MTKQLHITDIFTELTDIVGRTSQEDFSTRWLNQGPSYLRTIKAQRRQPTIQVWEDLLASLIQYEQVLTTGTAHPTLKQKAQQIRVIAERIASHIASQQIATSQRRNEARMLMMEAVKKAIMQYEGDNAEDAPPISIGF